SVRRALRENRSGITVQPDWSKFRGLQTRLGGAVKDFTLPPEYPRKKTRGMGRVAQLSTRATELALRDARLFDHPALHDGNTGVAYGTTSGSPPAIEVYARHIMQELTLKGISPNDYIQLMSHTSAANLGQFFEIRGRIVPTCSACTSGSQGIGYGFEAIQHGLQECMVTGGAEELHVVNAAVFDIMFATSTRNDAPSSTPRPFDVTRDGLVVSEGAGTLVLEALDHELAREAPIHAELLGFATNCDGEHMTHPGGDGMERVMRTALASARCEPSDIDYVNAHGTGTETGDIAESQATARVFGARVPVSTLKGAMGHTLGACGALEAWMSIEMMREGWCAPTLNLENVDPRCGDVDFVRGACRDVRMERVMSNNFAFGGVNTSLIFGRWEGA
ncbi:MAG TPA: beta-ketoacyl-ACP synthase, partial [Planctomycetota bacterium]|nr:beta-ketoacyl-ACP synthase [Planctomycetota bacterium]